MPLARADLESLLRTRHLDRTLTTALPPLDPAGTRDDAVVAPTGVSGLDALLGGGLPRGQISELAGPRSSGRTSLMLRMVEGNQTTCVLVGSEPMARSSAGLTIKTGVRGLGLGISGSGPRFRHRLFDGLDIRAQVVRARVRRHEEASVALSTIASHCA